MIKIYCRDCDEHIELNEDYLEIEWNGYKEWYKCYCPYCGRVIKVCI